MHVETVVLLSRLK